MRPDKGANENTVFKRTNGQLSFIAFLKYWRWRRSCAVVLFASSVIETLKNGEQMFPTFYYTISASLRTSPNTVNVFTRVHSRAPAPIFQWYVQCPQHLTAATGRDPHLDAGAPTPGATVFVGNRSWFPATIFAAASLHIFAFRGSLLVKRPPWISPRRMLTYFHK